MLPGQKRRALHGLHNYKTAANYKLLSLQAILKIKYDFKSVTDRQYSIEHSTSSIIHSDSASHKALDFGVLHAFYFIEGK